MSYIEERFPPHRGSARKQEHRPNEISEDSAKTLRGRSPIWMAGFPTSLPPLGGDMAEFSGTRGNPL